MGRPFALGLAFLCMAATTEDAPSPESAPEVGDTAEEAVADGEAAFETAADSGEEAPELSARGRYNLGLAHFEAGEHETAAAEFLAARDTAGPDPELRYRAAFNLGLSLAAQAGFGDRGAESSRQPPSDGSAPTEPPLDPEQAIDTLRQSAAWFNDAIRLSPPDDDEARINLELVSKWILQLADQLNEGDKLEARLNRLIDDQRGIRDQVRRLLTDIANEDARTEPIGFQNDFDALAVRERMLMAEVSDCVDLAAEERLFIEQTPEQQRLPEQQSRAYQLAALTDFLERARQSLSDARRRLRRLEGERAHRRVDAALAELKRAREQLLDPVTVLQAVARDEQELLGHTRVHAAFADGAIRLDRERPGWLTDKHLAARQEDIGVRTGGILGRFEAVGASASDPSAVGGADPGDAQRAYAAATEAVPILDDGLAAMRAAISALESGDSVEAVPEQDLALAALAEAIELFADVKNLIELAYASQQGIVALLTPDDEADDDGMDPADRAKAVSERVSDNQRRIDRLQALLQEDAASAAADAGEQDEQARQAQEQRYQLAETLRAKVAAGLARLEADVKKDAIANARTRANEAVSDLDDLRRLFFSIVEHLAALRDDQENTHDRTATLQVESSADLGDAFAPSIGAVAERQSGHVRMGDQLTAALARQADVASAPATGGEDTTAAGAQTADPEAGERLAKAAEEVRKAAGRMTSAATMLDDAAARATTMSPELEPALEDQLAAMEHLENALRELVPPQQRQQQGQDQQQGDQPQQQPQPGEDERMSQRQALKRLQAIRDREAERQRRRPERGQPEPVEKDW